MLKAILAIVLATALCACAHDIGPKPIKEPVKVVSALVIHFVPDATFMPWGCQQAALKKCGNLLGCAWGHEIWVIGYDTPEGIVADWHAVGHEIMHVARGIDKRVADPDGGKDVKY